ncbi:MGMT family protein [Rothia sp. HC945]|uniref:MGMT family protein n=1 Tax=Rothia sp. HC945 TaxID=3171170 RepID=UPI002651AA5F|nr:MGMT family protein [Kocuria sp.]MDN5618620.1 MGMT family protein [Kocuria sp.]MDN5654366.1 MGMT family protein [Kocuria sp.]
MDDVRVERILRAVECVPEGRVATYGLIGRVVGEVPRVVGYTMSRWGGNVPWWRIVNAQGVIPGHESTAVPHWEREGLLNRDGDGLSTSSAASGLRVRLSEVLADEDMLARAWAEAVAGLPET